jgi:hypothetical protein
MGPIQRNDDPNIQEEDSNPYAAATTAGLNHAVSELSSWDAPNFQTPPLVPLLGGKLDRYTITMGSCRLRLWRSRRSFPLR